MEGQPLFNLYFILYFTVFYDCFVQHFGQCKLNLNVLYKYNLLTYSSACVSSSSGSRPYEVRLRNQLEWANAHIRWRLALWRGVLFMDESRFSLYRADGRQCVRRCVGEQFADVNVVDRVAHSGGGVMACYRQAYVINTGACYWWHSKCTEIPWRDPEAHSCAIHPRPSAHFQHDNARPHVARICSHFLEAENIPVLAWPAYSPNISPIEQVWDALDRCIWQRVPVPANIQQLRTAIEEEWTNIPQATINKLINSMWRRCVALREANGGHSRYWLVFGTMNAERYIQVLEQHMLTFRQRLFQGRSCVFQQDNAKPHAAAITTAWLCSRRLTHVIWNYFIFHFIQM